MNKVNVLAVINRLSAPTARESVSCEEAEKVYDAVAELMEAAKIAEEGLARAAYTVRPTKLAREEQRERLLTVRAALSRCNGEGNIGMLGSFENGHFISEYEIGKDE